MAPDAGANDALAEEDLPTSCSRRAVTSTWSGYALLRAGSRPAARAAMARARERGMTVSVDPSSSALLSAQFLDDAEGAGLLLPNASEAHALTGESEPELAARALAARFGEVVVTLGPEGALWTDGEEVLRAAAEPVEAVVDSTGAGDAFAAGLLSARASGASTAEALAAGCRLAARAVATPGARPERPGAYAAARQTRSSAAGGLACQTLCRPARPTSLLQLRGSCGRLEVGVHQVGRPHHARGFGRARPSGNAASASSASPAPAGARAAGRGSPAPCRTPRRAGSRPPRAGGRPRARRSPRARCSAPARRSSRSGPVRASGEPSAERAQARSAS